MTDVLPPGARCASHPSRIAADACPRCARPRCGADAAAGRDRAAAGGEDGCPTCRREHGPRSRWPCAPPARWSGSSGRRWRPRWWGCSPGWSGSQYVEASFFSVALPALGGLLTGVAALKAAGLDGRGPLGVRVRLVGVVYGVLGAGYAFRFVVGGGLDPLGGETVLPYLAAAAGAWLGTLPPRRRSTPGGPTAGGPTAAG